MENHQVFTTELDAAMQAHLEWTRRVLRCAVLRISPGNDVLDAAAHSYCRFGKWLSQNRSQFESLDNQKTVALDIAHKAMHDAIRDICIKVLEGIPGEESDLGAFETNQTLLVSYLSEFKTMVVQSDSQIDPLTGLPLRHRLELNFSLIKSRAQRQSTIPSVMIIDIDRFKEINDRYGHAGGDIVLKEMAACLKNTLRGEDQIFRYGGEEFVVLSELSSAEGAIVAGQRLLDSIHSLTVSLPEGEVLRPTATIGIALVDADESFKHALHRADIALYTGKDAGRDRYVIAETAPAH
jgi:diguanylate cyclase (GGDEF)-like protein